MISKVESWAVSPDLNGIRDFMLQQLRESLSFDCGGDYYNTPPKQPSATDWRRDGIARAKKDIVYHRNEREKEIKRVADRNDWLRQLREALVNA